MIVGAGRTDRNFLVSHTTHLYYYRCYYYMSKSNGQPSHSFSEPFRKRIQHYSYDPSERLGSGYSSEVFRGRDERTGGTVAIKVVNLKRVREKGLEILLNRQIRLLKEIREQHIVTCLDVFMTRNNYYIVTEFCSGGDLSSFLSQKGRLTEEEGLKIIRGICEGLCYLHGQGILHRDIKPQNILLNGSQTKIADFGFAIKADKPIRQSYTIGSPLYMSPEALVKREYSTKNDIWALGITMFEMLQGRPPWTAGNQRQLKQSIKGQPKFRYIKCQKIQSLILGCLQYESSARLQSLKVLALLEEIMGIRSCLSWEVSQNKQNEGRCNLQDEDEQVKKSMRNNYNFLKWLINCSRFCAKLLPRLQQHLECSQQIKQPLIQLTARLLHLSISKLQRVDQVHQQLGLTHFDRFRRTNRFSKIQAVTAEYHQRYLLLLTRLPYRYHHPSSFTLQIPNAFFESLGKLAISNSSSQNHLIAVSFLIAMTTVIIESKKSQLQSLINLADFQKLVESQPPHFCTNRIAQLLQKRAVYIGAQTQSIPA